MCTAVEYRPYTGWSMEKCCHTRRCATITSQHGRTRNDTMGIRHQHPRPVHARQLDGTPDGLGTLGILEPAHVPGPHLDYHLMG